MQVDVPDGKAIPTPQVVSVVFGDVVPHSGYIMPYFYHRGSIEGKKGSMVK